VLVLVEDAAEAEAIEHRLDQMAAYFPGALTIRVRGT
jgi:hypothetical protein